MFRKQNMALGHDLVTRPTETLSICPSIHSSAIKAYLSRTKQKKPGNLIFPQAKIFYVI